MGVTRGLEYAFGWNHFTMQFMGIWPDDKGFSDISNYKALLPILSMLFFVCAPQTINLIFIWGNFDLVVENLSMGNMTITLSMLKTIAFWLKKGSLKPLLTYMADDWTTNTKERQRRTMMRIAETTRGFSIRNTLMSHAVVFTYVVLRWLSIQKSGVHLLFRAYFPYDTHSTPYYQLTLLGQLVACLYAATSYTAVDTFVGMLVLHVCGQLSNLRHELKNLRGATRNELRGKINYIARRHENLIRFAESVENCFNMMLLIQMLGCTIQLCFQCFQALESITRGSDEYLIVQFIFLSLYVFYVLLQLYLYCYVGEQLVAESTEMAYAAYECPWYDLAPSEARSLLFIMNRAQSPLRITAGKFCSFSRALYCEILKTSMGYISVLYAVKAEDTDGKAI